MAKVRVGATVNELPSMTRQADAESCDINTIMKRYEKTGVLPPYTSPGFFADVSALGDFHVVTDTVAKVTAVFEQLPAALRSEFGNDVAEFVNWATDPQNAGELKSLIDGAEKAPVVPAPEVVPAPVEPQPGA